VNVCINFRAQDGVSLCTDLEKFLTVNGLTRLADNFAELQINLPMVREVLTAEVFQSMGLTSAEIEVIIASRSVSSHLMLDEMHA
jgi:hypothetical protein